MRPLPQRWRYLGQARLVPTAIRRRWVFFARRVSAQYHCPVAPFQRYVCLSRLVPQDEVPSLPRSLGESDKWAYFSQLFVVGDGLERFVGGEAADLHELLLSSAEPPPGLRLAARVDVEAVVKEPGGRTVPLTELAALSSQVLFARTEPAPHAAPCRRDRS